MWYLIISLCLESGTIVSIGMEASHVYGLHSDCGSGFGAGECRRLKGFGSLSSVLQPPRNEKLKVIHKKCQIRKPKEVQSSPVVFDS